MLYVHQCIPSKLEKPWSLAKEHLLCCQCCQIVSTETVICLLKICLTLRDLLGCYSAWCKLFIVLLILSLLFSHRIMKRELRSFLKLHASISPCSTESTGPQPYLAQFLCRVQTVNFLRQEC